MLSLNRARVPAKRFQQFSLKGVAFRWSQPYISNERVLCECIKSVPQGSELHPKTLYIIMLHSHGYVIPTIGFDKQNTKI